MDGSGVKDSVSTEEAALNSGLDFRRASLDSDSGTATTAAVDG
jgi:hypothetical protein